MIMPVKYRHKDAVPGGIYHIYNRGLDGRAVFMDQADYDHFLEILGKYLGENCKKEDSFTKLRPCVVRHMEDMNLKGKVRLMAFCLMPDHFHLLISQEGGADMTNLLRRLMTSYVMGFNKRHGRRGPLFEGVYKGVRVDEPERVVWVSRMIHLNSLTMTVRRFGPVETVTGPLPEEYMYSSFREYFGPRERDWVIPGEVLKEFERINNGRWKDYRAFVLDNRIPVTEGVGKLMID
jgi:putative transposase